MVSFVLGKLPSDLRDFSRSHLLPALSALRSRTGKACREGLAFSKEFLANNIPAIAALGYDIAVGNSVTSPSSATVTNAVIQLGMRAAVPLLRKTAAKALLRVSTKTSDRIANRIGDIELMREITRLRHLSTSAKVTSDLEIACRFGNAKMVKDLFAGGSRVEELNYPLLRIAADRGDTELLKTLYETAETDQKAKSGRTPLMKACFDGDVSMVKALLQIGINIDKEANDGRRALHYACYAKHPDIVRVLVEAGADIHKKDISGRTAFDMGKEDIQVIKILTRTEHVTAFDNCKNIHEFCNVLFPPSSSLPANWREIVSKVPKSALLEEFEKEAANCEAPRSVPLSHLSSVQELLPVLLVSNPLFAKAWELANRTERLQLEEVSDSTTSGEYCFDTHKIRMYKNMDLLEKAEALVFETFNALQRESFILISRLLKEGDISREEQAILKEWIELNSVNGQIRTLSPPGTDIFSFGECWATANVIGSCNSLTESHAEVYRKIWDILFFGRFFAKNPEVIQKRIADLAQCRSPINIEKETKSTL